MINEVVDINVIIETLKQEPIVEYLTFRMKTMITK